MTIQDGLTITNQNAAIEKAKGKQDGAYRFRGFDYYVKNGNIKLIAYRGEVYQFMGDFHVLYTNYVYEPNGAGGDQGKKTLRELAKSL